MRLLNTVRRNVMGLIVLAFLCLVMEQVIYCVITPAYFFQMLVSPVFWGVVSLACFTGLWWMDMQYPQLKKQGRNPTEDESKAYVRGYHPIWDNPLNIMNPVYIFRHIGE